MSSRPTDNNSNDTSEKKKNADSSSLGGSSASRLLGGGPVTTTKALLVNVVAPRMFSTKSLEPLVVVEEKEEDVTTKNLDTIKEIATSSTPPPPPPPPPPKSISPPSPIPNEVIEVQQTGSKVEVQDGDQEDEELSDDDENKNGEEEEEVTPEEAAAIVVTKDDPEDARINMEELLRIAFKALAEEMHLLNVPTFTTVHHHTFSTPSTTEEQEEQGDDFRMLHCNPNNDDASTVMAQEEENVAQWIQLQVMVNPTSLGIVLERMERIGVGTNCGTISVFKAEFCQSAHMPLVRPATNNNDNDSSSSEGNNKSGDNNDNDKNATNGEGKSDDGTATTAEEDEKVKERLVEAAKAEWMNAATRLRIEQVREQIVDQAAMTFDFIALLTVASILAGVGLITDNTVVIVASMLVSPIMGPVLGLTFGSRIQDWPLVKSSLFNETLALLGCVVVGAFVGLGSAFTPMASDTWPTNEMQIRGEATGLLTGIAIAIPSGMGVCLSILGGNTSSLVGVAISASLLPPAVNTGICFVYAIFLACGVVDSHTEHDADDFVYIGAISFALTALNIVCIWVSGLVMFEIKEVAPTEHKSAFWSKEIKVARQLNKEKPPPVDMNVLRKGVHVAMSQRNLNSANNNNKTAATGNVSFRLAQNRRVQRYSLDEALAMRRSAARHPIIEEADYGASLFASGSDEEDANYVDLHEVPSILGVENDHDHFAVASRLGKGRYL